ncbi:MAG: hypothetical protein JST92_20735 [Deltaproteobacteria bacterium]|nr:hypothetical protein [Deltaproteobacteria bacterium]
MRLRVFTFLLALVVAFEAAAAGVTHTFCKFTLEQVEADPCPCPDRGDDASLTPTDESCCFTLAAPASGSSAEPIAHTPQLEPIVVTQAIALPQPRPASTQPTPETRAHAPPRTPLYVSLRQLLI